MIRIDPLFGRRRLSLSELVLCDKNHTFAPLKWHKKQLVLMNYLLGLKRPFIWLSRFRYRCGYGVHSPFAFSLITDIIYEKTPYYAYGVLAAEIKKKQKGQRWKRNDERVNHLLFRLVNRVQPAHVIEVGTLSDSSLYLQAAKPSADYLFASNLSELYLESGVNIGFLYLNDCQSVSLIEDVFRVCSNRTTTESLFVIKGIRYSKAMKELWMRLQQDHRVGITFDLYDVGLLFFDTTKIKQHYIVNF